MHRSTRYQVVIVGIAVLVVVNVDIIIGLRMGLLACTQPVQMEPSRHSSYRSLKWYFGEMYTKEEGYGFGCMVLVKCNY